MNMDHKEASIKQLIVVTDGQSNLGGNPVLAAKKAFSQNIIVNTIGIIDQKQQEEKPYDEIVNIACAGGGQYELSYIELLAQTIQSLSHKTVTSTLQDAVNKQLREIMGTDLVEMAPDSRSKILNYIDEYADEIMVYCCILLDCSGSMAPKIQAARRSIMDLLDSFNSRRGKVHIAVIGYPDEGGGGCRLLHNFGDDPQGLERSLYKIKPKGGTPTAAAIEYGIRLIKEYTTDQNQQEEIQALGEAIG